MRARPGIRTRTVQILGLLPLPVGLGGRWRAIKQRKDPEVKVRALPKPRALCGTRTHTARILSPLPLPIGLKGLARIPTGVSIRHENWRLTTIAPSLLVVWPGLEPGTSTL